MNRNNIRKRQSKFSVITPTLAFFGKQAFDVLKHWVDFSDATKKYFNNGA